MGCFVAVHSSNPARENIDLGRLLGDPSNAGSEYRDAEPFEVSAADHTFAFYPAGSDRFEALINHIEGAERSLDVFFYMFRSDRAGGLVRDALTTAAKRGVEVHLIVDDFGSDAPRSFFDPLVEAGGTFDLFQCGWSVRYLIRNHQKFVVADGNRVMTGGFNVSDDYFKSPEENGWCDLGATVKGPIAEQFGDWFASLRHWVIDDKARFRAIRRLVREWNPGEGGVQLLLGGPTRITSGWARRVQRDFSNGDRLDLVMAYFSPPKSIRQLIHRLGELGKARLVMAGKSDNTATIGASRSLYRRMLESGVLVSEFQPSKLHMKLIVIDNVTYFGSANMDMRSIRLNLEVMMRVEDRDLAERMRGMIDHLEAHSTAITAGWFSEHASFLNRARWRLGYWLVSVVDYTVTRRLNF